MKLISVNVSLAKKVPYLGRTITTGIFKEPVRGRVMVRRLNIVERGGPLIKSQLLCQLSKGLMLIFA